MRSRPKTPVCADKPKPHDPEEEVVHLFRIETTICRPFFRQDQTDVHAQHHQRRERFDRGLDVAKVRQIERDSERDFGDCDVGDQRLSHEKCLARCAYE